jgi:hypothetical protein
MGLMKLPKLQTYLLRGEDGIYFVAIKDVEATKLG